MKKYLQLFFIFFFICTNVKVGVTSEKPIEPEKQLKTFVSILPQSYFVERIGGENVRAEVMVEPGTDPHTFEPTPKQMMKLWEADLYFGIGFPFEEQILKKLHGSNPKFVLVHTDKGVQRRTLDELPQQHKGKEELHHHHANHALDPHIWLSPPEIKIQVTNIYGGLAQIDPDNAKMYKKNLENFLDEIEQVHAQFIKMFEPYRGRFFFAFHPAFGYFADVYGLLQMPIEIEGKIPTPKQIEALIGKAKEENVNIIFVSPQFNKKSAETIADAIGGSVISINPLEKNVLENLEDMATKIENSFKQ